MNSDKSSGPDGIHARALKELKYEIAKLLTVVCNLVFKLVSVPKEWRWEIWYKFVKAFWSGEGDPAICKAVSLISLLGKFVGSIKKKKKTHNRISRLMEKWINGDAISNE